MQKKKVIILMIFSLLLYSCKFFQYNSNATEIAISSDCFTIAWDISKSSKDNIISYNIYYRFYNSSSGWILLDHIDKKTSLEYTISKSNLNYGKYEFAVSSFDYNGIESELHTSQDMTADPKSGWYVNWIGSK